MKCINFNYENNYIKDFIKLTKKIYKSKFNCEDPKVIKSLLLGKHPLSNDFKLNKFLVYKNDKVVGRFVITEYPDEKKTCYLGFFECINDKKVAKFIFEEAEKFAKEKKYNKIVGPVDASFWIKYRLKINKFDIPYTGEPYNTNYYYKMFLDNKYKVIEHYVSNVFERVDESYNDSKFTEHYKEFMKLGYEIVKPKRKDFNKCLEEIYYLIMELYSTFPIFKKIEKEEFIKQFSSYKTIINMNMVRMAYYKDKAVGFCISIPNYHNRVYHVSILTPLHLLHILFERRFPKEYIMLYLGADRNHKGLGKAIAFSIAEELKKNNLPSINALIRDGNVNIKYGENKITDQYEYVLLERVLK